MLTFEDKNILTHLHACAIFMSPQIILLDESVSAATLFGLYPKVDRSGGVNVRSGFSFSNYSNPV